MDRVYALLVGIDAYPDPVPELFGCVNDVAAAQRHLLDAGTPEGDVRVLVDGEATKTAVVDVFREHLGQAGPGDSALFWYSGHGSTAPVPAAGWHRESSGTTMQTLVCVDSREPGGADLYDKELALLIKEVAARGPHVAVVLDCCHAGGGTRTPLSTRARHTPSPAVAPEPAAMLPGVLELLTDGGPPAAPDHVLLSACLDGQQAFECRGPDGAQRGVFSMGLLAELRRAKAPRTYRELVPAVLSFVENRIKNQTPGLYPATEPIVDQPFLGGQVRPPVADMAMREVSGQWIVDVGSVHGMPADGSARVAVHGSRPPLEARVIAVSPARCEVEPLGWTPAPGTVYPVVLSAVATPPTPVTVGGDDGDDEPAAAEIRAAIAAAGPGGVPSPYLRLVPRDAAGEAAELVVALPRHGVPAIRSADGAMLTTASAGPERPSPGEVVRRLEHIARWRQIRGISNPGSGLADLVRLRVIPAEPGDVRAPRDRAGLPVGRNGVIELAYTPGGAPPQVFLRLDSAAPRPLHCVLLNLTDRFAIDAGMFPGGYLDAGASAAAGEGHPFELRIPEDRLGGPCPLVQDWLMLIASEDRINPESFTLTRLGTPDRRAHRGAAALDGIAEHLALGVHHRDAVRAPRAAGDWWTSLVKIVTRGPNGGASCH
ncbi:hypothetical protein CS0771_01060 [Catellatospora sp. IY07-71]|uniref:caspase family protein n=1 Tax=Catellatospora sp. IY07-71 TaxID=2728827 RepID=UPI001BB39A22|nr:caspase family protein [Catellatospora sp. IY07-71]BCJ70562.1 hypothetical protein CS0771_01060 [Catellatospora sp. IY07-71]